MSDKETKKLLILKTSSDICAAETSHIETIADLIKLECEELKIKSDADIYGWVPRSGSFDSIYLCGHADEWVSERLTDQIQ